MGRAGFEASAAGSPRYSGVVWLGLAEPLQGGVNLSYRVLWLHAVAALVLDLQVDLLAEDGHVSRCLDADADLLAHDRQHRDLDVVPDHDALIGLPCEYKHPWCLPG